jgi:hypothetical protein
MKKANIKRSHEGTNSQISTGSLMTLIGLGTAVSVPASRASHYVTDKAVQAAKWAKNKASEALS